MVEPNRDRDRDLTRTVLSLLFIGLLIAATFWVVRPFLGAVIWATMIVVATWPLLMAAQKLLGGRRKPAVALMTVGLLLVFLLPFTFAIATLVSRSDEIVTWARAIVAEGLPDPPGWLSRVPFVGGRAVELWQQVSTQGIKPLLVKASPYAGTLTRWFVTHIGDLGSLFVQLLLTVIVSAILWANAEDAAAAVLRFGRRLGGERGETIIQLAGQAIRGIALGVVGTALVQATLGGLGLLIAGVPLAAVLTAVMFILAVAQIGPLPVLVPAVIWLYVKGHPVAGTFLLVLSVVTGTVDNVIRPMLIRKGVDLPFLLVFAGVVGGLMGFGLIGIFVGPIVLAVAYTLLQAWVDGPAVEESNAPVS